MEAIQLPPLRDSEKYLCGRIDANGEIEHTAFVAVNNERMTLAEQRAWAEGLGAVLMDRTEALAIYEKHRDLVEEEAYWTDTECEWDASYAWCQRCYDGVQFLNRKRAALRAVAVRRFKN